MITGLQIRAARAILRWTVRDLATFSGLSFPTVNRLEQDDGVPLGRSQTLSDIQKALEAAGIEFIGTPDDGPGVRVRTRN
jgi:transcriptional regulator with XRE-family HTH domain